MLLGSVVGGYRILEIVGEGGMGTVCRAVDVLLEREVALKLLRPELTDQPDLVARFRTEAVALARLNHPHIVTVHHLFRDGEQYFMVLEFVRGETIDKLIARCAPIPWQTAVPLICQSLNGLEHAHILKVIHRDIKPSNLILTEQNAVKIMDFGIARMLETDGVTQAGNILGTVKYMSPEQITGQEIDFRADIYGIAAVLYEMISGRPPYSKQSEYELIRAKVEDSPEPLRKLIPSLPRQLDAIILRALAQDPADRYQSAALFRTELQSILDDPFCEQEGMPMPATEARPGELLAKRNDGLPLPEIGVKDLLREGELADPEDDPVELPVTVSPVSTFVEPSTTTLPINDAETREDKTLIPAESASKLSRRESDPADGRWWSNEDERAVDQMIAGLADRSTATGAAALRDEPPWGLTAATEALLRQAEDQPTILRRYPLLAALSVLLPILAVAFVIGFAYTGNEGQDEPHPPVVYSTTSGTQPVTSSERLAPIDDAPGRSATAQVSPQSDSQSSSLSADPGSEPRSDSLPTSNFQNNAGPTQFDSPPDPAESEDLPTPVDVKPEIQLPTVSRDGGETKPSEPEQGVTEEPVGSKVSEPEADLVTQRKPKIAIDSRHSLTNRRVARPAAGRPAVVHRPPAARMVAKAERRPSPEAARRSARLGHRSKLARNGTGGVLRDGGWTIVTE